MLIALKRMFTYLTQSSADKEVSDTVEGMITRFEALLQMPKLDTNKAGWVIKEMRDEVVAEVVERK